MHIRTASVLAAALMCCAALASCRSADSSAVVSIQSIQPSGGTPLLEGDRVTFEVTVRAQGIDKPSTVGVVVQSEGNLLGASQLVPIESGKTATLRVPVAVPDVASIDVITPLYVGEVERTSVVDKRNYKVLGRRG